MRKDLVVKTPSLSGSSELLVIAPIKPGLVMALDAVTYTSRARLLLRALHAGRRNAHEVNLFRAVSDAVERVGVIHTLRVAVLEPDAANKAGSILLSVNFDGTYEAYVRTIWQKAARLLDLIFCNTVDHVTGWDHPYEAWSAWLRSRQVDTPFYYSAPSLTKGDVTALRMQDRFQRRAAGTDLLIARTAIADAEHIAWGLIEKNRDPQSGPFAKDPGKAIAAGQREGVRQGLQALVGVYRLQELYMPDTPDGKLLHRAAHELLPELVRMWRSKYADNIKEAAGERFRDALQLLSSPEGHPPAVRRKPPLPAAMPPLPPRAQAGILSPVEHARRACVCLVSFTDPAAAAAFLREFMPTPEGVDARPADGRCLNLALTFEGLRACGVPEHVLDGLPIEFRQGMQRRAGVLGDLQANHPRRWSLPLLNWPAAVENPAVSALPDAPSVPLEAVHALLHVRVIETSEADLGKELKARFDKLGPGVRPLSVQWLRRNLGQGHAVDHFGYADGASDPRFGPDEAFLFPNQVHLGEALVGHANAADAAPVFGADIAPLLQDASYLVVRKLRQDVEAFDAAVAAAVTKDRSADFVKAKLMGRWPDGTPLVNASPGPKGSQNDFSYDDDPNGSACPLASHIRRANPRLSDGAQLNQVQAVAGARPPRLFRRGMSYTDALAGAPAEKGLFFMAYNASIGEQFEVVQRWLTGGNSSGAPSGATDPICGVAETGRRRFFMFEDETARDVVRMALDGDDELGVEPPQWVRLAWGAYFLAPSLDGVEHLATLADAAARVQAGGHPTPVVWSVAEGVADIERLRALESDACADTVLDNWKAALEDPESRREFRTASIWAAIRQAHGGLLRTPYGVLVADGELVRHVLTDVEARYTVKKYQERLVPTIGAIFLGLDAGPEYDRQALACNGAIEKLTFDDGYTKARCHTRKLLAGWVDEADKRARAYGEKKWELNFEIRDVAERVLARLLEDWFGLAEGVHLMPDGFDWVFKESEPARYPGAFYTPSRYTFQPRPTETVHAIAKQHGQHLRKNMALFLHAQDSTIAGPVTRAVLDDPALKQADGSKDYDLAARTLAGAIMGFVPTTDHNLRRVVDEWLRDQTVWHLRSRTAAHSLDLPSDGAKLLAEPIQRAMMLRPMPEFVWRTAVKAHSLPATDGTPFDVHVDDRLVLGLVSATHQGLARGARDVVPVFGGDRWASPAPRHACPGMPSALGVMAGVLSAIIDAPQALRPFSTAAVLSFEGPVTAAPARPKGGTSGVAAHVATKGRLLAWGDSWFQLDHPLAGQDGWDLARSLARLGWNTAGFALHSSEGLTLQEMAHVQKRTGFYRTVYASTLQANRPLAILIDGGGNDVHHNPSLNQSQLHRLAAPAGSSSPLMPDAVRQFVYGNLHAHLSTVLKNLVDVTQGSIPIFVHGYDHPIPDGIGFGQPLLNIPWLDPLNNRNLYSLARGAEVMQLLIDELNKMIGEAVAPFAAQGVRHLNLTGTLAAQPGYSLSHYRPWWLNELHPTEKGYDVLAAVVDQAITAALASASS